MNRPLRIGLSACYFHADPKRPVFKGKTLLYLEQSIAHFVLRENVLAYMLPSIPGVDGTSNEALVRELDGFVLQGGSDVSPQSYGEDALRPEWSGDRVRDLHEIALVHEFFRQGKPVLGICRGLQLLNVAMGGTLYQDIGTQVTQPLNHRDWEIYDQNFHDIRFEKGSLLSRLYSGKEGGKVNTVHHQAIHRLGRELEAEAKASDGIIEAVRSKSGPFAYAVQWHPEFQDPKDNSLLDGRLILREFLSQVEQAAGKAK